MSELPNHKPVRFPGRPKGQPNKSARVVVPVLSDEPVEIRTTIIREAGQECVEILRCVAGVCTTLVKQCKRVQQ